MLTQSCLTLRDPMDCTSVHGISQATILEWVAFPTPRDLSDPGIEPPTLESPALAGSRVLHHCATWDVQFPLSTFLFTSITGFTRSFPESHFRRPWGSRYLRQWTARRRRARSRSSDRPVQQLGYNQTLPAFLFIPGFHRVPRITGSHHNTSEENLLKKTQGQDL